MEQNPSINGADSPNSASNRSSGVVTRKRSTSGAGGLLSKLPFIRSSGEHHRPRSRSSAEDADLGAATSQAPAPDSPPGAPVSMSSSLQQQQQLKTRRRRGSLRKVALLGRGAQRERRESRTLSIETKQAVAQSLMDGSPDPKTLVASPSSLSDGDKTPSGTKTDPGGGYGLGISGGTSDITPRPSMDGYASRSASATATATLTGPGYGSISTRKDGEAPAAEPLSIPTPSRRQSMDPESTLTSPTISYSTTDDEDALHMSGGLRPGTPSLRPERSSMSSGSESYFPSLSTSGGSSPSHILPSIQRRRSATTQRAKSPLALTSLAALSTTPLPQQEAEWDYSETEWWGWVVLIVTWMVFVIGMGSCLGVWSWAWDVGTTPYAPPELEDDPTLPIVGYYPALIILTGVMAWVWVVAAWVGMKYFRHARVSGD